MCTSFARIYGVFMNEKYNLNRFTSEQFKMPFILVLEKCAIFRLYEQKRTTTK